MGNTLYGHTLAEHEHRVTVPRMYAGCPNPSHPRTAHDCNNGSFTEPEIVIAVSAHGGGTVGESYAANGWDYSVYADGREVISGRDLRSPEMLTADSDAGTHAGVARALCAFLASDGEALNYSRSDAPELSGEYDEDARAFLVAEYERFSLFSAELD